MGPHVDHLAKIVDDHRKVYGTRREDWDAALKLIYAYPDTEPPVLRYQVEMTYEDESYTVIGQFPWKDLAENFGDSILNLVTPYRIRDLHTNSIV